MTNSNGQKKEETDCHFYYDRHSETLLLGGEKKATAQRRKKERENLCEMTGLQIGWEETSLSDNFSLLSRAQAVGVAAAGAAN